MIDLSHWKLTIPSGKDIPPSELVAGYQLPGSFETNPKSGAITFTVPNIGGTTSGSHYSRCELREMRAPGGDTSAPANNWTTDDGGILRARLRVDHVSTTGDADKIGRVIIGQIHGPSSEVIRLYYRKQPNDGAGRIYAGLDSAENETTWSHDIASGIPLGARFGYEIMLRGLRLTVRIRMPNGTIQKFGHDTDAGYEGRLLYFKAGAYSGNNTGTPEDYSQATFFRLSVSHP